MKILLTNDDGYQAKGIHELAHVLSSLGDVFVVAPMTHQSGMSMAISLSQPSMEFKDLGYDQDGVHWAYFDGTPASCSKFAINNIEGYKPDIVVSGVNHGPNAATASCYSGTLGAAAEAVLNGVPGIGVSLLDLSPDADFSAVGEIFPDIFKKLIQNPTSLRNVYYNINFPKLPASEIKGVKAAHMGFCRWVNEFNLNEDGTYRMQGQIVDCDYNTPGADHHLLLDGWVTIVPHHLDTTCYEELQRIEKLF
ncbi:MAG: 5'/3'-nucleotidase SurE [Bacteroidales bacterium]|nr:5'/3'-nucleotidase SurE [Bacteroidales bacterium]